MPISCFNSDKISRLKKAVESMSFEDEVRLHKALGNEKRQKVLHILKEEACCVCDLAHILDCPVPNVSQYLKILSEVGLVKSESQGKFLIYSLNDKAMKLHCI